MLARGREEEGKQRWPRDLILEDQTSDEGQK